MHKSLKDVLRACRLDLKKHLSKRDKWVKEWPGQVSLALHGTLNPSCLNGEHSGLL